MQMDLPLVECPPAPTSQGPAALVEPAASSSVVFVRHRRARRYVLRVDPGGGVRVTIPRGGSRKDAGEFLTRHRDWVLRQQALVSQHPTTTRDDARLRQRACEELPARLLDLAQRHGVQVARVSIRNQRTRWGSCGRNGHICINWRLVSMPEWVRDYVLVHELMHLRRLDHSPAYWALVAAAYPEYRAARQWLREHGGRFR
jgi:predicted metal-dependent hydrolase